MSMLADPVSKAIGRKSKMFPRGVSLVKSVPAPRLDPKPLGQTRSRSAKPQAAR